MQRKARRLLLFLFSFSFSVCSFSQKLKKADKVIIKNLENHIQYLASDELEGRRAGTAGETKASEYISHQFQQTGLEPKGDHNNWLQAFEIDDGKEIRSSTYFYINGSELQLQQDYFPLAFSSNATLQAIPAIALPEKGMPWFLDLKDWLEENNDNPHFDLYEKIRQQAESISMKGATALILYNSSNLIDNISFQKKDRSATNKIPIIYITKSAAKKFLADASASIEVKLKVEMGVKKRTGHNVIAYINNHAPNVVILGAHYDHLGHGEDGNSFLRNDTTQIFNGADDNASGTAALIELGKMLRSSKLKANNYLLIAFSGEELGLLGSKYFTEHPTIDLARADYMINMDMVGRLNDSSKTITIGGIGTSSWSTSLSSVPHKYFNIKYDSSGTGPSDHTSFYQKNIPVLFFFTGWHKDYHRPTDDENKINYTGELTVIKYIYGVIEKNNNQNKLAFTKTRETMTGTTARFNVTLGIMPDYTFTGSGVRVDAVSENRPAQKAGIKTGDIIIQLGEHHVTSLDAYMDALGKFKKGDISIVTYKRGNDILQATVQF